MPDRVVIREGSRVAIRRSAASLIEVRPNASVAVRQPASTSTRVASGSVVGPRGESGGRLTVVAGADLSGHRAVTPMTDDRIEYADPATIGNQPVWVTIGAVIEDDETTVVAFGDLDELSWTWDPGNVYLGSNGVLTQTPPTSGALVVVAEATSPTSVFVDRQPTIEL